jgi:hypothetical protein
VVDVAAALAAVAVVVVQCTLVKQLDSENFIFLYKPLALALAPLLLPPAQSPKLLLAEAAAITGTGRTAAGL